MAKAPLFTKRRKKILLDFIRHERDGRRIVNGVSTTIEKYPYFVAVYNSHNRSLKTRSDIDKAEFWNRCSGTIFTKNWVVTAAHCVKKGEKYVMVIAAAQRFVPTPHSSYIKA